MDDAQFLERLQLIEERLAVVESKMDGMLTEFRALMRDVVRKLTTDDFGLPLH